MALDLSKKFIKVSVVIRGSSLVVRESCQKEKFRRDVRKRSRGYHIKRDSRDRLLRTKENLVPEVGSVKKMISVRSVIIRKEEEFAARAVIRYSTLDEQVQ